MWVSHTPASAGWWSCIISEQSSEADSPEPLTFHPLLTAGCPVPLLPPGWKVFASDLLPVFITQCLPSQIKVPLTSPFLYCPPPFSQLPTSHYSLSVPHCHCARSSVTIQTPSRNSIKDKTAAAQLTCPALCKPFFHIEGQTNPGQGEHHFSCAFWENPKLHCRGCTGYTDSNISCKTPSLLHGQTHHLKFQMSYLNP